MHLPQKPVAFCLVGEDPKPLGADEATASSSGKSGSFKKGREAWKMIEQISGQMVATKKRRGKPQDRSKLTRNKIVQIRMTEEEVSRLKEAAAAAGMSMASFILAGIDQRWVIKVPGAAKLRLEMIQCHYNLNQANRLGNTANKERAPGDMESILEASKKLEDVLDHIDGFISKWDADITEEIEKERK